MPVVIIEDGEKLEKIIDGATFYYKRVPGSTRNRLMARYTSKRTGVVNWTEYGIALIKEGVTGWDDQVVDIQGKPIPFSLDVIPYIPDRVQGELVDLLGENIEKQEGELKNSPTTPSSKL